MSRAVGWALLAALAVGPPLALAAGQPFYVDILTRLVCLAAAATSLNLILGHGGMISFGHAAYIGIGAYAVGIPAYYEIHDGWLHILIAVACSALFALATGAIALRTRGVYFIMITMAFAQMVFFAVVSIEEYGGDDGLVIDIRSEVPLVDLEDSLTLYYACFAVLLGTLYLVHRLVRSRFGMVLEGARGNERRMAALGFAFYRHRLAAYTLAGALCGLSGAMLGNFTNFISPEMMDWTRSGELIFMVVLGGTGALFGPLMGAAAFLLLEELLSGWTIYWQLPFGLLLILVVLFARGGLAGLLEGRRG